MERPSLNVLSPSSPGMLQDAPQLMPGQVSVSVCGKKKKKKVLNCYNEDTVLHEFICLSSGEVVVRQSWSPANSQRSPGCGAPSAA